MQIQKHRKAFFILYCYVKDMILNNYTYIKGGVVCRVYANTYEVMEGSPSARFASIVVYN